MTWTWHGTSSSGDFRRGEMTAGSRIEVQEMLESLGISVISIDEKGAPAHEQMSPILPVAPSIEAADRVASTIDAMSNHVREAYEEPVRDAPTKNLVQEIVCEEFSKAQRTINSRLSSGANVIHLAMNHDSKGILQVIVVLEFEKD
jgi:hypothetical protein